MSATCDPVRSHGMPRVSDYRRWSANMSAGPHRVQECGAATDKLCIDYRFLGAKRSQAYIAKATVTSLHRRGK
jgi:hypothetical protein